jgi:malonyl-CoA decarboxylase
MFERLRQASTAQKEKTRLKLLLEACDRLLTEAGESISQKLASEALALYQDLTPESKLTFFLTLAERFNPDVSAVRDMAARYAQSGDAQDLIDLIGQAEPPRQELFRRLNQVPHGCAVLVRMRVTLLQHLKKNPSLRLVDADLQHLLSSWFNPGFLSLESLNWQSPAGLLEKIIAHEAVHEIDGWADLRRRLEPDRRLFAYFHPALPNEPLIFVEVALLTEVPNAIAPLLDRKAVAAIEPKQVKVAAFYSISNCQPGLKGVHLGNFLIKRVAESLQKEFPSLKTFCTLSPIPGLVSWMASDTPLPPQAFTPKQHASLERLRRDWMSKVAGNQNSVATLLSLAEQPKHAAAISALAGAYLKATTALPDRAADPVARFHLNNGARLERINPSANLAPKGIRQSLGAMVNYLYDLDEIESNHEAFVAGNVTTAKAVLQTFV